MFKDDDEEEENTFGVTRYPCMPSLVALQQMRNRLHLAFLGRKLMKWTALATGREMRRLAQELYVVYDGFAEDFRNAFMLLARSRYFIPHLNAIVSEAIGKKAGVVVQQTGRTVSGVKIVQFEIFETEFPPYPHLGIEKGGQTILETKKAFLELLKRLIMMMQLRAGFLMVELANKNANKKMKVLKRIVIPRTNMTVGYVLTELEEMAREEFHRLKKVQEKKKRDYELRHKKDEPKKQSSSCRIFEAEQNPDNKIRKPAEEPEIPTIKSLIENIEPIPSIKITPESVEKIDIIPSKINHYKSVSIKEEPTIQPSSYEAKIAESEIQTIKSTEARQEGFISDSVEDIIKSFDETKSRISYSDEKSEKLKNLHRNIEEIINLTERLKTDGIVTASVEDFLKLCDETINILYVNQKRSPSTLENDSKGNSFLFMDSCTNNTDAEFTNAESNRFDEERPLLFNVGPCDSCTLVVRKQDISKENMCITFSQQDENEDKYEDISRSQTSKLLNSFNQSQEILSESSEKGVTSNETQENQLPLENKIETSPTGPSTKTIVDRKSGYFEKKVQQKITRTKNTDGTISEHRETITVLKEKHYPTKTEMVEDDTLDENIYKQVNICIVPNQNNQGFIRSFSQTRSDSGCKHTPYRDPCLRFCLSVDNLSLPMQERMSFYDTNNLIEIELLDTEIDANKYL